MAELAIPHPIPYQGSKRRLAARILAETRGRRFVTLHEPFAGSGALTLAAAAGGVASRYALADSLAPLAALWAALLADPDALAAGYARWWAGQEDDPGHYERVRAAFNRDADPAALLYLLARCVKLSLIHI